MKTKAEKFIKLEDVAAKLGRSIDDIKNWKRLGYITYIGKKRVGVLIDPDTRAVMRKAATLLNKGYRLRSAFEKARG